MDKGRKRRRQKGREPLTDGAALPTGDRSPLADPTALEKHVKRVRLSLRFADREYNGKWWWPPEGDDAFHVLELLGDVCNRTWQEVYSVRPKKGRPAHHHQYVTEVCPEAQRRVAELELEKHGLGDELFRFSVTETGRLWGFIAPDGAFEVLWWDPDHQVYPLGR